MKIRGDMVFIPQTQTLETLSFAEAPIFLFFFPLGGKNPLTDMSPGAAVPEGQRHWFRSTDFYNEHFYLPILYFAQNILYKALLG